MLNFKSLIGMSKNNNEEFKDKTTIITERRVKVLANINEYNTVKKMSEFIGDTTIVKVRTDILYFTQKGLIERVNQLISPGVPNSYRRAGNGQLSERY